MRKTYTIKRHIMVTLSFILATTMILNLVACSVFTLNVKAEDLTKGVTANSVTSKPADEKFIGNTANFSVDLFKKSVSGEKNTVISPLSALLALSMTANGANGDTLSQMQTLLGGGMSIDELNQYLYSYTGGLTNSKDGKLTIANSIWFKNKDITVSPNFLQKNADFYKASAYQSAFDEQTIKDINGWVKKKTNGKIETIVDRIPDTTIMYLINATVFDAKWEEVYEKKNIYDDEFTANDGTKQSVKFMRSNEFTYLDDGKSKGFVKYYKDRKYSFVGLLPNEGITIKDYVSSLTGQGFLNFSNSTNDIQGVKVNLPKYNYEYSIHFNDALKTLGMTNAFDDGKADFTKMGKTPVKGRIFIEDVLQKAYISVDEQGTKAGAVTKVEMGVKSGQYSEKTLTFNRPFVYAIIDTDTHLPIFMGTVMSIKS